MATDNDKAGLDEGLQLIRSMEAEEIRRRYAAELLSSGGLVEGRLSLEVLFLLPSEFVVSYTGLFNRALVEQASVQRREALGRATVKTGGGLGGKAGTGKKHKEYWSIKDERAFDLKTAVDKALHELAKDMQTGGGGKSHTQQCSGARCGRFMKKGWRFCPNCGTEVPLGGKARVTKNYRQTETGR